MSEQLAWDGSSTVGVSTNAEAPTDPSVKKEYTIGCHSADDWEYIHEVMMRDGTLEDNIPNRSCECSDKFEHSPTRGTYLLDDVEAEELSKHERVEYINLNPSKYPGTFKQDPTTLQDIKKDGRYVGTVKHVRDQAGYTNGGGTYLPGSPDASLLNRGSYQLIRHEQQQDPFQGDDNQLIERVPNQYGTGKNVDLIVCDESMWHGHIEFMNSDYNDRLSTLPRNYIGGNALDSNGKCDILDIIQHAPYYIDPDFFNNYPSNAALTTRWDGTVVPNENNGAGNNAGFTWWSSDSTQYRSAKFVTPANGGTATGAAAFGALNLGGYLGYIGNGGNFRNYNTGGFHGTPCASLAYGRQYGWAYNANKWHLNLYGSGGLPSIEVGFDIIKLFHLLKPDNPLYGTKDPTVTSNSWGYRVTPANSGYYYYRSGDTGSGGNSFNITNWSSGQQPTFMTNMEQTSIRHEFRPSSMLTAGDEMVDAGVIVVCSAGNTNQKIVSGDHPDYNNYYSTSSNTTLTSATGGTSPNWWYNTINRQGFPGQVGSTGTGANRVYKTICVGALDDDFNANGKEQKVSYSNMGNLIDCYASADKALAACDSQTSSSLRYNRYDGYYSLYESNQLFQSQQSQDREFGGTSAACPVAAGIIATKLEHNRDWTYADVKNWLRNEVGVITSTNFYYGSELTSATDTGWSDHNSLHDDSPVVIWDALTGKEPPESIKLSGGGLSITGVNIKY